MDGLATEAILGLAKAASIQRFQHQPVARGAIS